MSAIAEPITAADKAWADKMARLAARKPLERTVTFVDEDLVLAVDAAQEDLGRAEADARVELDKKYAELKNVVERRARVTKDIPRDKVVREKQKVYDAAVAARDEAELKLTHRALAPAVYEQLQAEYPATEDQRKKGQSYNIDRFGPVLVAATCTDPMTPEQAASLIGGEYELLDEDGKPTGKWQAVEGSLGFGEASLLFTTAITVNEGSQAVLGKG